MLFSYPCHPCYVPWLVFDYREITYVAGSPDSRSNCAREHTLRLLAATPVTDWFTMPPAGVSHIAWQVGHLTMAEYRLGLERIRGPRPEDEQLVSAAFLKPFGRESIPSKDPGVYPWPGAIARGLRSRPCSGFAQSRALTEADLDQPSLKGHPLFTTKIGSLQWCSHHEMIHAGQIGLLRRQLGHSSSW